MQLDEELEEEELLELEDEELLELGPDELLDELDELLELDGELEELLELDEDKLLELDDELLELDEDDLLELGSASLFDQGNNLLAPDAFLGMTSAPRRATSRDQTGGLLLCQGQSQDKCSFFLAAWVTGGAARGTQPESLDRQGGCLRGTETNFPKARKGKRLRRQSSFPPV